MEIHAQIYESVEKVLSRYPLSWQRNYYQNKKNLLITREKQEINSVEAYYDQEKNHIIIFDSNEECIPHELFHMSFRDKEKVEKEIIDGTIYGNGVSFKQKNSKQII